MKAHCNCGKVTLTLPLPEPLHIHICHCTSCRLQSSSAFGISAIYPFFPLPTSNRYLACWITVHEDIGEFYHWFCGGCGTRLVHTDGKREAFVKGGCMDGLTKEMLGKAAHIWTRSAIVDVPVDAEQYEQGYPDGKVPWSVALDTYLSSNKGSA